MLQSIKVLKAMPYAQAHVRIYDDEIFLISYATLVAEITTDKAGERWLRIHGLYSMTTRRHISAFLKEYCPTISYYTAKDCYEKNFVLNIATGVCLSYDEIETK